MYSEMMSELHEWYALTPAERFAESMKLWEVFLSLGGSLEPEPDTQSPFYSLYFEDPGAADGAPRVRKSFDFPPLPAYTFLMDLSMLINVTWRNRS